MYRRLAALSALALVLFTVPAQADKAIVLPCGETKAKVTYKIKNDQLREVAGKNPCPDRWLVIWWGGDESVSDLDSITVEPGARFDWRQVTQFAERFGATLKDTRPCLANADGDHVIVSPGYLPRSEWC